MILILTMQEVGGYRPWNERHQYLQTFSHPPIYAVYTVDKESGVTAWVAFPLHYIL
jgi:hypothetical protein